MVHSLCTKGEFTIDDKPGTIEHLEGRFSFINQLDWYNNKIDHQTHEISTLSGRERGFYLSFFDDWKVI